MEWNRFPMKRVLLILPLLLSCGAKSSAEYSNEIKENFTAGCIEATPRSLSKNQAIKYCQCTWDHEIRLSDTSNTENSLPTYHFDSVDNLNLPKGCQLVGVELLEDAEYLPSFRHPRLAAYILGSERYGLSKNILKKCDKIIKVPTKLPTT